jgi:hypothetical protein
MAVAIREHPPVGGERRRFTVEEYHPCCREGHEPR